MLLLLSACGPVQRLAHDLSAPPSSAPAPLPGVQVLDEAGLARLLDNGGDTVLVVNFWATWCGPCVQELTTLRTVAAEFPDARFALVSVDDPAGLPLIAPFLRAQEIHLPAYLLGVADASGALSRFVAAWPNLIPVTLVVEPGGLERTRFAGAVEAGALRAALGGAPP